jgi:hypothetical protein
MQVNSRILFNAVKRISNDFPILKEARREVLEDLMDIKHAKEVLEQVKAGKIYVESINTQLPSPFGLGLIMAGYSDIIKIEDKQEFLRRMHELIMAKIALKEGKALAKQKPVHAEFSYTSFWEEAQKKHREEKDVKVEKLKMQVWGLKQVPAYAKEELARWIDGGKLRDDVLLEIKKHWADIEKEWPEELVEWVKGKMKS